MAELQRIW